MVKSTQQVLTKNHQGRNPPLREAYHGNEVMIYRGETKQATLMITKYWLRVSLSGRGSSKWTSILFHPGFFGDKFTGDTCFLSEDRLNCLMFQLSTMPWTDQLVMTWLQVHVHHKLFQLGDQIMKLVLVLEGGKSRPFQQQMVDAVESIRALHGPRRRFERLTPGKQLPNRTPPRWRGSIERHVSRKWQRW